MKQIAQLLLRFGGALLFLWSALVTILFFRPYRGRGDGP